ncbi:MAG: hypothetical protein K0U74_11940 [Alphaproteobacteria bacterium]|nr:hypothetical protein [Alphaproteobacteria bacterium]
MSDIEKIRELEASKQALVTELHDATIAEINDGLELLEELGFNYTLATDQKKSAKKRKPSQKTCPVCKFATTPPHDRRHHRTQDEPAPFSQEELAAKSFTRVSDPQSTTHQPTASVSKPSDSQSK